MKLLEVHQKTITEKNTSKMQSDSITLSKNIFNFACNKFL